MHVAGKIDGSPHNIIKPGDTWDITLPIKQEASTNWYHPHLNGKTSEQVHAGLAGLYLIEDENSQNLPLPNTYGADDIPVIVQDRNFTNGVMDKYSINKEMMDGKFENTLVVNGTIDPYVEVPKGWVRLRLLNGSNARSYDFHLKNNEPFYKIATEGGFLEKPVEINSLRMTPGERNEIMIDMSDGKTRQLLTTFIPVNDNISGELKESIKRVLEIRVDNERKSDSELPEKLNTIKFFNETDAIVRRTFKLSMDMIENNKMDMMNDEGMMHMNENSKMNIDENNMMDMSKDNKMNHPDYENSMSNMMHVLSINGKSIDISRIDERVRKGDIEIWTVTRENMNHPFHMHGTSFQILSQNGRPPAPEDKGWKDTIEIGHGPTELIMKFDYEATDEYPYMYHCHILEHEDGGMMGQFTVK